MTTPPHAPWPPMPGGSHAEAGAALGTRAAPEDLDEQPTLTRPRDAAGTEQPTLTQPTLTQPTLTQPTLTRLRGEARTEPLSRPLGRAAAPEPWQAGAHRTVPRPPLTNPRQPKASAGTLVGLLAALGGVALVVGVVAVVVLGQLFPTQQSLAPVPATAATSTATDLPTATPSPTPSPTATPLPLANSAAYVTTDTTTAGSWQGTYGTAGYSVVGDAQQLPAAIQLAGSGATDFTWEATTTDTRAPQKATNPADRVAACWYAATSFSLDVNISDGQAHQLALYLLDWDQLHRIETVTVLDATSGTLLDARSVSNFDGGQYLVWTVRGHVTIQVTNAPGSANAVVSGVFFS